MEIRNPYKVYELARVWQVMIDSAFSTEGSLYLPNGGERIGGSHSQSFWAGYHNQKHPGGGNAHSVSGTIGGACYRAGRDFRRWVDGGRA
jgi:hypothetical protein